MFGMISSSAYFNHLRFKAKAAGDPIEVTMIGFKKALKENGLTKKEIELQANIAKNCGFNSTTLIGDKLYRIKENKNDKQAKKHSKKASKKSRKTSTNKKRRTSRKSK